MNSQDERFIKPEILTLVLSKMLDHKIIRANYQFEELQGGTVGVVQLVTGMAETFDGKKLPYKLIWKTQKKWQINK